MGCWHWDGSAIARAASRGTGHSTHGAGAPRRCPHHGAAPPPTPSPTSRPRPGPGPPPEQAPAAQPGGRVREPAAPARAWRQPRPGGTQSPPRDLRLRTPSGDLPKTLLGMPIGSASHGTGTSAAPRGRSRTAWAARAPAAPHGPIHPQAFPPQARAGSRRPQPSCCVRAGDPVAGHGVRVVGRGRMLTGQCSFLRRWPGEEG